MSHSNRAAAMVPASPVGTSEPAQASIGLGRLGVSPGQLGAAALAVLYPDFITQLQPVAANGVTLSGLAAWSGTRDQDRVTARAAALGVPFLLLDEGLLRAPPGVGRVPAVLSAMVRATVGPSSPADILDPARLLTSRSWETPALLALAADVRREIVSRRLGGRWWNPPIGEQLRGDGFALVDVAEASRFPSLPRTMLAAALTRYDPRKVVLLAPNRGTPRGLLRDAVAQGCIVLTRPADPWDLIDRSDRVYAADGEIGFLALLAGREVCCLGDSYYSGWGITTDDPKLAQKPFPRSIDEVFAGACLVATRYLDPYRNKATSVEEILAILSDWRKVEEANRRIAVCVGMSFWKRRQVAVFLRSTAGAPAFRRTTRGALRAARGRPGGTIAVWASRVPAGLTEVASQLGTPLLRVEDGFVRSVGLGSDFMPAASLVLDSRGMHFDPRVRSDLEHLLAEAEFDLGLIERARRLIARLVDRGITKYNLGTRPLAVEWPPGRRRILVPGQVEDDLSVRLGGGGVRCNLNLLGRVRTANPDAFILYKPHPDVEAGHRKGAVPDRLAGNFADSVIRDVSTAALLGEIDEVHTLTSLTGFEALLRCRRVVVYGRPFYAGWGLTVDLTYIDRGRRLTLDELVAGALILYPRYLDPVTRFPCGPEIVIERLENPELWRPGPLVRARRLQGVMARRWDDLVRRTPKLAARPPAL